MSIRTPDDVNRALSDELIWRKKELTALKFLVQAPSTNADRQAALVRGGIALLYAHWEGFVKEAGRVYMEFLRYQRLTYEQLAPNFLALVARNKLFAAAQSGRIRQHLELTRFFRYELGQRSNIAQRDPLGTRGNLSSQVLRDITDTLGLDYGPYATKERLIDERLVARRNTIAHGQYLRPEMKDFLELYSEVLDLLEMFRTQVDNAVSTGAYKISFERLTFGESVTDQN